MKFISLHLPKTAGGSFGATLKGFFADFLLRDYGDRPISKPAYERNKAALLSSVNIADHGLDNISCVHGHFLPVKYLLLSAMQDLTFVTWMRDPVQRMISHYEFWQRTYNPKTAPPHHKQVIEEEWTLEQFCLSPQFRNIYSQYLWGFPLLNFEFIGITEFYESDLAYFAENYLYGKLKSKRLNANNKKTGAYSIDTSLRERIESYHKQDIVLYKRALELRLTRSCSGQPIDCH